MSTTTLTAQQAADATGMSKPGIIKAMRSGRISASKNINGEWEVEPVELFRVYKPTPQGVPGALPVDWKLPPEPVSETELITLRVENEQLRQRLRDKDEVISDLRKRLDSEADERRKLTLILTDSRTTPPPPWWRAIIGSRKDAK